MTKYTATFKDGYTITKTSKEVKNRMDFYNAICKARLGKEHGPVISIEARPYGKE